MKGIGQFADDTVDLQLNNNVWKRAISFNGLHFLTYISNFSIINTNETKITKKTVSAPTFNNTRDYEHTFNYEDYLEEMLPEYAVNEDGSKLTYTIGNDDPTEWELISKSGCYYLYKIVKEGFDSPVYKVSLPMIRLFNPKSNNTKQVV